MNKMRRVGTRPIDSQEVFSEAVKLFDNKGTATTLEVKNKLRERGFFAKQEEVSAMMLFLANRHNWDANLQTSPQRKDYLEYSWHQKNNLRNKISIFLGKNSQLVANFILIVEFIFLFILALKTFEWVKDPSNENYEPLIGLIASVLAIFQWLINQLNRNIFSGK